MSKPAANPAASPHLCLCMAFKANRGQRPCSDCGEWSSLMGVSGRSKDAAVGTNFRSPGADENSVPACVCRFVSRLLHGHCCGAYPAPCGSSLFCFGYAALRVTVSVPDPP
jgi:hypothetical protein